MSSGDDQEIGNIFKIGGAEIIWETFPDETVIVDLAGGVYFTTSGTGAFLWSGIAQGRSLVDLEADLRVTAAGAGRSNSLRSDIRTFVASLVENRLALPTAAAEKSIATDTSPAPSTYALPLLVKREDLSHLLAIDPPTPDLILQMQNESGRKPV